MKNIQLPKDIVKYVKKKIIGYVALFVFLELKNQRFSISG